MNEKELAILRFAVHFMGQCRQNPLTDFRIGVVWLP